MGIDGHAASVHAIRHTNLSKAPVAVVVPGAHDGVAGDAVDLRRGQQVDRRVRAPRHRLVADGIGLDVRK